MKKYEKRVIPAREETLCVETTCDLCGRKMDGNDWSKGTYDVDEINIRRETGVRYPDYTSLTMFSFDVCPDCFESKLIPWMQSQGAQPQEEELEC